MVDSTSPSSPPEATSYYSPLSSALQSNESESYLPRYLPDNASIDSRAPLNAQYAPSIAPSESVSIRPGNINSSGNPKWGPGSSYGHKDEESYMNALRAWAEEKKYMTQGKQIDGFYGSRTMDDYINSAEPISFRRRRRSSASKVPTGQRKKSDAVAIPEEDPEARPAAGGGVDAAAERALREEDLGRDETEDMLNNDMGVGSSPPATRTKERRRSSIGNFLRRVRTGEKV